MTKTVLITGAARRIGRFIALAMAERGWDIAIHYHHSRAEAEALAEIIRAKGRNVFLAQADMRDAAQVSSIFAALDDQGASIDCLVNNASFFAKDTIRTLEAKSWQPHIAINLFAPLQLIRDFCTYYKGDDGCIINITDGIKGWSISPDFLSYTISKNALENTVQLLAPVLAPAIRINAIAPGATLEGAQDKEDTFAKIQSMTPLKRTSALIEIMQALDYILEGKSVTGQILNLAGGL